MTKYHIFVLWLGGTWSVSTVEVDNVHKYISDFYLNNIGKVFHISYEEAGL